MKKKKTQADLIDVVYPSSYLFSESLPFSSEDWTKEFPAVIKSESSADKTKTEIEKIRRAVKLTKEMVSILNRVRNNNEKENLKQAKIILKQTKDSITGLREWIKSRIPKEMRKKFPFSRKEGGFGLYWRVNVLESAWLQSINFFLKEKEEYDARIREILRHFKLSNIWNSFIRILVLFNSPRLENKNGTDVDVPNGLPIRYDSDFNAVLYGTEDENTASYASQFCRYFKEWRELTIDNSNVWRRPSHDDFARLAVSIVMKIEKKPSRQFHAFQNLWGTLHGTENKRQKLQKQVFEMYKNVDREFILKILERRGDWDYDKFRKIRKEILKSQEVKSSVGNPRSAKEVVNILQGKGYKFISPKKLQRLKPAKKSQ